MQQLMLPSKFHIDTGFERFLMRLQTGKAGKKHQEAVHEEATLAELYRYYQDNVKRKGEKPKLILTSPTTKYRRRDVVIGQNPLMPIRQNCARDILLGKKFHTAYPNSPSFAPRETQGASTIDG